MVGSPSLWPLRCDPRTPPLPNDIRRHVAARLTAVSGSGQLVDGVRTQLETHVPVARTHAEALVERVREAGKTSEVGQ